LPRFIAGAAMRLTLSLFETRYLPGHELSWA
jgi:hypothetical protein